MASAVDSQMNVAVFIVSPFLPKQLVISIYPPLFCAIILKVKLLKASLCFPIVNVYHHILYQEYAQLAFLLYFPPMFIVMD